MSSVFSSLRTLVIFLSVGWCFFAVGGEVYHVINRANGRMTIFTTKG
jgi:hypothetical protein